MEQTETLPARPIFLPLWQFLHEEFARQKGRLFLWTPFCLALGIGFYFSLPAEPPLWIGALSTVLIFCTIFFLSAFPTARVVTGLAFLICLGFLSSQIRTQLVYTPILEREIGPAMVEGTIESIEDLPAGKGDRVILSDLAIEDLSMERTPRQIRLSVRKKDNGLAVGQRVQFLAKLMPPAPPVVPGGFDLQKYMFFQGIGAVGFVYKVETILSPSTASGFLLWVEKIRDSISRRITAHIQYPEAGIAMALLNGRQASIIDQDRDDMRDSGLAHILSISGLHIGLFSGAIFFFTRFVMACIPGFALRHPIKKYAAVLAFCAAYFYMLLAGSTIPAQRSLMMAGLVFLAIILDRSPVSLRLLIFAALVILLLFPESLDTASFQMSFSAVFALVLFYESTQTWRTKLYQQAGWIKKSALYVGGVALTSLVATLATAPFTLFHFQQTAIYSVLANVLVVPLLGVIIMPAAAFALALMPLGLEMLPLKAMEFGLTWLRATAHWVAGLPYAALHLPAWPPEALYFIAAGIYIAVLWRGYFQTLGLVLLVAGLFIINNAKPSDIFISSDFDLMAIRSDEGTLLVSAMNKERRTLESWERLNGLIEGEAVRWPKEGMIENLSCGEMACRITVDEAKISFLRDPSALQTECGWADLVVVKDAPDSSICRETRLITRRDAYHNGAMSVRIDGKDIHLRMAEEERGSRPWGRSNLGFREE